MISAKPLTSAKSFGDALDRIVQLEASKRFSVFQFMSALQILSIQGKINPIECTTEINKAFSEATRLHRTVYFPDGVYLTGNLLFGDQNKAGQSIAPCGIIGESKAGVVIKAIPNLTGTLLQSWSVAGVTFRDFSLDTAGTTAVAWDCRWRPDDPNRAGPSTQCVIEHMIINVHDNFKDGVKAHVNWDDLNDTYPHGVTVRADGGITSYTNKYISMVQSGGLTAMSGCIWTGGFLNIGCQNGHMIHSWGTGTQFAAGCLNHFRISAGYMYANPVKKTVFWSESYASNTGLKSLIIEATEMNTEAAPGILSYFDINLFGSLHINGCEFIGTAPALFGAKARGDGIGPAYCKINGGTHNQLAANGFDDCPNGSHIEVEVEGMRNNATSQMVTKNRGGTFEPIISGTKGFGNHTRGGATFAKLIRQGNIATFKLKVEWSNYTTDGTEAAIVTGFPIDRDADGIEGAYIGFSDPSFAGSRASFSGNQIVFYKDDNSQVILAASGSVTVSGFYSVKA